MLCFFSPRRNHSSNILHLYFVDGGVSQHQWNKSAWWRHQMETFSELSAFVRGIHRSPVNSPHKGEWRGALVFSLICAWINGWISNGEAGGLRRHRANSDVTVMRIIWSKYMMTTLLKNIPLLLALYEGNPSPPHKEPVVRSLHVSLFQPNEVGKYTGNNNVTSP